MLVLIMAAMITMRSVAEEVHEEAPGQKCKGQIWGNVLAVISN